MLRGWKGRVGSAGYHHSLRSVGPWRSWERVCLAGRRSGVRIPSAPPPQHLVSIKPRCGVGAGFVVACCAVSDMTTGLVTIQIGCCPSLDAMNTGHAGGYGSSPGGPVPTPSQNWG